MRNEIIKPSKINSKKIFKECVNKLNQSKNINECFYSVFEVIFMNNGGKYLVPRKYEDPKKILSTKEFKFITEICQPILETWLRQELLTSPNIKNGLLVSDIYKYFMSYDVFDVISLSLIQNILLEKQKNNSRGTIGRLSFIYKKIIGTLKINEIDIKTLINWIKSMFLTIYIPITLYEESSKIIEKIISEKKQLVDIHHKFETSVINNREYANLIIYYYEQAFGILESLLDSYFTFETPMWIFPFCELSFPSQTISVIEDILNNLE